MATTCPSVDTSNLRNLDDNSLLRLYDGANLARREVVGQEKRVRAQRRFLRISRELTRRGVRA